MIPVANQKHACPGHTIEANYCSHLADYLYDHHDDLLPEKIVKTPSAKLTCRVEVAM
jgi:hypothetical protein